MIGDFIISARTTHDYALICDGALVPSGVEYDELRSIIGDYTPDMRDMFIRGNRVGRTLLSYESDGNKLHFHGYSVATQMRQSASGTATYNITGSKSANTTEVGNSEVTVKNRSANIFIVYKEVVALDMAKVDDLWDFMQLVKNNFFNADCTKAIPYGNGLYATDDIASISNMVLDKEEY